MGLKCSVIGHKYGETEVEREREEQGSEVVITIREHEACERCGKTRIVSENKEVTAIETPSDIAGDMLDDGASAADDDASAAGDSAEGGQSADLDGQESVGGRNDLDDGVDGVGAEDDDAELLDDESPAGGGSQPEDTSTAVPVAEAEESESPLDAEEAAMANDPESDDGVIIDGDDPADDRQPGEWPAEPNDDGDDWAPDTDAADDESEVEPFGGDAVTVPSGQFRCPKCEFTTDVASSSLRAGDFCPECHKGALVNTEE